MIYNAYFHSIMNFRLISWWNSSQSAKIFKTQKNIIIIITGCRSRDWCRDLFNSLKICNTYYHFFYLRLTTKINSNTIMTSIT